MRENIFGSSFLNLYLVTLYSFFSQLVSEFLRDPRTHAPPQSFRMGDLLHEMKEIEQRNLHHTPVRGTCMSDFNLNKWVL